MNPDRDRRPSTILPPDHGDDFELAARALREIHDRALQSCDTVLSVAVLTAEYALAEMHTHLVRLAELDRDLIERRKLHCISEQRFTETMRLVHELVAGSTHDPPTDEFPRSPPAISHEIRLCFFGSFSLRVGERRLELAMTKASAVLRYIGTNRRATIGRDVLIEAIWPGLTPDEGRRRLHQAVYSLRVQLRDFASGVVRVANLGGAYRLEGDLPITTDIDDFEAAATQGALHESAGRLDDAIAHFGTAEQLYTGDFLSDAPLEEWVYESRERLRLHYVLTSNRLAELLLTKGRPRDALTICERVLSCEPSNEECVRTMMYCYTEIGQRSLALKTFALCESWMARELGVTPSEATTALYDRIRSSDSP